MRFGSTLRNAIYEPWESHYIDYSKLKRLLREDEPKQKKEKEWTEQDEGAFVEELVNVQLEKVHGFQAETYRLLQERTSKCQSRLDRIVESGGVGDESNASNTDEDTMTLNEVSEELDNITKDVNELEKFSRINFTGFLKAVKKHDRKRGSKYRVRPLLQVRLAALPFNSEDYSPLLYQLSSMYSFVRQRRHLYPEREPSTSGSKATGAKYTSYKFWVHPENILEVKTYVLRRLPVLVYNPQSQKTVDGSQSDPTLTSLYFDNTNFSLYDNNVNKTSNASSLRLRWYGKLKEKPEIYLEKKTVGEEGDSEEVRLAIKEKYIQPFITGQYSMEKSLEKVKSREGDGSNGLMQMQRNIDEIQDFIKENGLQPMMSSTYTRTAFQIPGEDKLRISLDTDVNFIREDCLDNDDPSRAPDQWHRQYPIGIDKSIKSSEVNRFPYALLDIRVKDGATKKTNEWVEDLMASHLVKEAPSFSKFVHGIAVLFEDNVNSFPFWLSDLDTDIRRDPEDAFQEEQSKKAQRAEEEAIVGSLKGSRKTSSFVPAVGSPVRKGLTGSAEMQSRASIVGVVEEPGSDHDDDRIDLNKTGLAGGLRSLLPSLSTSKYARSKRQAAVQLPPGVKEPGRLIKDSGPVRVEPKVWLANQRTFIKWQHVSVLLASLSLGLYNAAGDQNAVGRALGFVYTIIALFAGGWGWWQYLVRSRMIEERSGKDFDNVLGPVLVCLSLIVALCLNFGFNVRAVLSPRVQ